MPLVDVPITVTNAQGVDTPAPFQQMIQFNPSLYSFLMSDLSNIRFTDEDYSALLAWLESYSSTSATAWVRLNDGIKAGQSRTLHMLIGPVGFDGQFWGEAPQLSSAYGQYDSGASVFNYYTNFAGTSLPSGWTSYTSEGSVTVNNGVLIKGSTVASPGENGIAYQASSGIGSPPYVVDYGTQQTTSPSGDSWGWNAAGLSNFIGSGDADPFAGGNYLLANFEAGIQAFMNTSYAGSATNGTLPTPSDNTFIGVFTQEITSSDYYTYYNYTQSTGQITGTTLGTTSLPFVIMVGNNEATYAPNGQEIYWFRIRAYPPNGVMPSVTVRSPKIYNYGYTVYPW
jgi:hypothetical protein